ncbi:MAG: hypothetical protein LBH43_18155 [Treponema sp.]|nr:hypothetical protein [Treponema sp.]
MKDKNIFMYMAPLVLLPLFLDFVKEWIKQIPWLYYTVAVITTLLTLFYLAVTIHELLAKLDAHFKCKRRRIDRLIGGTQKKMRKIIAGTGDASVMDYALGKLYETYRKEVYLDTLAGLSEAERDPAKKKTLLAYKEYYGGRHEN